MPEIVRATWMRVLKFFFFPITFEAMYNKPVSQGTPLEKGLAGALAVTPEVATITTLELVKIGIQLDSQKKYKNSGVALVKDVIASRGALGCMAGWQGVQARQMLWTGTYFATLDTFKRLVRKVRNTSPLAPPRQSLFINSTLILLLRLETEEFIGISWSEIMSSTSNTNNLVCFFFFFPHSASALHIADSRLPASRSRSRAWATTPRA